MLTLALCVAIGVWLGDMLSYGIIGFALLYLLILLFVSPIIVYMFPLVSLVVSVIAWGLIALFRRFHSSP